MVFPTSFSKLLEYYAAIDSCCCFLSKNKMSCHLSRIASIMSDIESNIENILKVVVEVCPDLIELLHDSNHTSTEVIFVKITGFGKVIIIVILILFLFCNKFCIIFRHIFQRDVKCWKNL